MKQISRIIIHYQCNKLGQSKFDVPPGSSFCDQNKMSFRYLIQFLQDVINIGYKIHGKRIKERRYEETNDSHTYTTD